jgi:hypothetical protein
VQLALENEMTIRVFVAATPGEWLPMRVLEFSMRETTTLPVEVKPIASSGRTIPMPRDLRNRPRTPFSFQRFLIPEICGFEGRAIYLDADMQVFTDIAQLWNHDMGGNGLLAVNEGTEGRKGQFSVMLLDCAALQWRIEDIVRGLDEGRYTYEELMHGMCVAPSVGRTLDAGWNSLEHFTPGATRLLHYTDMNTQPWVSTANPNGQLWTDCLQRAVGAGFISMNELEREIALGHARPSLMAQVRGGTPSRSEAALIDASFVAPYKSIRSGRSSPWTSWRARTLAGFRRVLHALRPGAGR